MNSCGWIDKIIRIDLSEEKNYEETTSPYAERFLGGLGIGAKVMWDEVGSSVRPFDPENRIIFATGPLTGTLAPTSGRFEVISKAPLTYPTPITTRSGVGGHWGPELKYAGYDVLIVQGRARKPVWIWICDGDVEIRSAEDLWGLDTFETQKAIMKELGSKVSTVCIGPAGENLVRFATIMSETGFSSGKVGFGAVMGSKRLKAITVKGTGGVQVKDPEKFIYLCEYAADLIHSRARVRIDTSGLSDGSYPGKGKFLGEYLIRRTSCHACPISCQYFCQVPGMEGETAICDSFCYIRDAKSDEAFWESTLLCDKYGIDNCEIFNGMIPWLLELERAGLIKEDIGIDFSDFGSRAFIKDFLHLITYREGIGDILAEGTARAARDKTFEGMSIKYYKKFYSARGQVSHSSFASYYHPVTALMWATDSRSPMIDGHQFRRFLRSVESGVLTSEEAVRIGKEVWGNERAIDDTVYQYKAYPAILTQHQTCIKDSLVLCDHAFPVIYSENTTDHSGDTSLESKLLTAATGVLIDEKGLLKIGERIWNLLRMIMIREGRRKAADTISNYHFETASIEGKKLDRDKFRRLRDEYYLLRGWDPETGIPKKRKLEDLNLGELASDAD